MTAAALRALTAKVPAGTPVLVELPAEGGGVVLARLGLARVETVAVENAEVTDWPSALVLKLDSPQES